MIVQVFDVNVQSAGYIKGDGFDSNQLSDYEVERVQSRGRWPYATRPTNCVVVTQEFNGPAPYRLWVGQSLLTQIGDQFIESNSDRVLKIGKARLQEVTEVLIARLRKHNAYPRRSERELEVQRRNDAIIDWLADLLSDGKAWAGR